MDLDPDLSGVTFTPEATQAMLAGRQPGLGEFLGANVSEGFWGTLLGQAGAQARQREAEANEPERLTREQWEAEFARPRLTFEEGITRGRARARAEIYDENAGRRILIENRGAGLFEGALGLTSQIVGGVATPENFLPIAGPVARGLRAVQAGAAAEALMASTVRAAAGRGVLEGVLGNALAAPIIYSMQAQYGEDVSWGRFIGDLAAGAVIGGAFGTAGGLVSRYIDRRQAAAMLDVAAQDVAAGRQAAVPVAQVIETIEDAAVRSAPAGARGLVDDAAPVGQRLDLPVTPEGAPLSREDFQAHIVQREPNTPVPAGLRATAGWKLHLNLTPDESHPLTMQISNILRAEGITFKVGQSGGQEGKGVTIYAGSRDAANSIAARLERDFKLPPAAELLEDIRLSPGVNARFDADGNPNFHQYGLSGVPLRRSDIENDFPAGSAFNEANRVAADAELRTLYGRFYTGTDAVAAYSWYLRALDAQRLMRNAGSDAVDEIAERAAIMEAEAGMSRDEATARAARDAASRDPDLARMLAEIEALRSEGRLLPGDDAILRDGAEAEAELNAMADGLEAAAACAIRRGL